MEADFVDWASMCVVVLDETLRADIPDLDAVVGASRGDARAVRVELD